MAQLPIFHFLSGGSSTQVTAELGLNTGLSEPSLKPVGANDLASMDTQPLSCSLQKVLVAWILALSVGSRSLLGHPWLGEHLVRVWPALKEQGRQRDV